MHVWPLTYRVPIRKNSSARLMNVCERLVRECGYVEQIATMQAGESSGGRVSGGSQYLKKLAQNAGQ